MYGVLLSQTVCASGRAPSQSGRFQCCGAERKAEVAALKSQLEVQAACAAQTQRRLERERAAMRQRIVDARAAANEKARKQFTLLEFVDAGAGKKKATGDAEKDEEVSLIYEVPQFTDKPV